MRMHCMPRIVFTSAWRTPTILHESADPLLSMRWLPRVTPHGSADLLRMRCLTRVVFTSCADHCLHTYNPAWISWSLFAHALSATCGSLPHSYNPTWISWFVAQMRCLPRVFTLAQSTAFPPTVQPCMDQLICCAGALSATCFTSAQSTACTPTTLYESADPFLRMCCLPSVVHCRTLTTPHESADLLRRCAVCHVFLLQRSPLPVHLPYNPAWISWFVAHALSATCCFYFSAVHCRTPGCCTPTILAVPSATIAGPSCTAWPSRGWNARVNFL
jgi:hypothetical protein